MQNEPPPEIRKDDPQQAPKTAADLQNVRFQRNRDLLWALYLLIVANKKWWLLPFLLMLCLLSVFVSLTGNSAILPAIYALF